jgi:hypothetical protein
MGKSSVPDAVAGGLAKKACEAHVATQRSLIERVINTIETGSPAGDFSKVTIYADGPHGMRQITYGRAQTTEYGNQRKLVVMHVAAGGQFSAAPAAL